MSQLQAMKRANALFWLNCLAVRIGLIVVIPLIAILLHNTVQAQERVVYRAQLRNPFCNIPTIVLSGIRSHALATLNLNGRPVIYIAPEKVTGNKEYLAFLMAHECCHHRLGHLRQLSLRRNRAVIALTFENERMELEADCCAATVLAKSRNDMAIKEAARRMGAFGPMPTGAIGYPAGVIRAQLISQCARRSADSAR